MADSTQAERPRRDYRGPALFSFGFRPFFLFGAIWAALAVPLWIASFLFGDGMIGGASGLEWHMHELLFGYVAAVVAGFLLTAVPNWTGRLPVRGTGLMILFALWAAGRIALLAQEQIGPLAPLIDVAFLLALASVIWREILSGRNWRNVPVCVLASLLALANIGFHAGVVNPSWHLFFEHAGLGVIATLIALIGGRIVPSFTRNWMAQNGLSPLPQPPDTLDGIALAILALALAAWVGAPLDLFTGILLLIAGAFHLARLWRWHGWRTTREGLVLILHLGYAWLPVSLLLMGSAVLFPSAVPASAALHALTAGAIGTMTLAVMTRASLGHTGRERVADHWTMAIYGLVIGGAAVRVLAPFVPVAQINAAYIIAALLWSGGFAVFALRYGPMLWRARPAPGPMPVARPSRAAAS